MTYSVFDFVLKIFQTHSFGKGYNLVLYKTMIFKILKTKHALKNLIPNPANVHFLIQY